MEAQDLLNAACTLSNEKEILLAKLEHQFNINSKNETSAQNTVKNALRLIDKHSEEVGLLRKSQEDSGTLLHNHIRTHIVDMENVITNIKNVTDNLDMVSTANFSVYDTIGKTSEHRIAFIKQKIGEFQGISSQNEDKIRCCNTMYKSGTDKVRFIFCHFD